MRRQPLVQRPPKEIFITHRVYCDGSLKRRKSALPFAVVGEPRKVLAANQREGQVVQPILIRLAVAVGINDDFPARRGQPDVARMAQASRDGAVARSDARPRRCRH